jgi:hypothetical protein
MIEDDVIDMMRRQDADARAELMDEFRKGRDVRDMLCLLHSKNEQVLWWTLYVVTEVIFDRVSAAAILPRLQELSKGADPKMREWALNALLSTLADFGGDASMMAILNRMAEDSDTEVKESANATIARMKARQIELERRQARREEGLRKRDP